MISLTDYFGHMSRIEQPTPEVEANALQLLAKVNALLAEIPLEEAKAPRVNSGWRPASYNANVPGAAPKSKHITGQAIDLADPEGALDDWCMNNLATLERAGLWLENPLATKSWCHLQSAPPRSGNRVFIP